MRLAHATNMTDRLAALGTLALIAGEARETALTAFAERYADEPLVLDKWFAIQAQIAEPGTLARIARLQEHPAFTMTNPNRVRALIGSFAFGNPTQLARSRRGRLPPRGRHRRRPRFHQPADRRAPHDRVRIVAPAGAGAIGSRRRKCSIGSRRSPACRVMSPTSWRGHSETANRLHRRGKSILFSGFYAAAHQSQAESIKNPWTNHPVR